MVLTAVVAPPALASITEYYRDSFASGGFSGSTGTVPWSTSWLESEGDGPDDGLIQVDNESRCYDGDCLVLGKDNTGSATVEREMDLSDAIAADLTFVYEVHQHGDGAGTVRLRVRGQSGSWTTLTTYALGTDVGPVTASFDLLPYAGPTTRIRFDVSGSTDDSHLNVDDLEVKWVASTNDPPVLDPVGNKTGQEGASLGFTATASDPNPGDSLSFSLAGGPPSGSSITSGGVFSWTPSESQGPGTYTFDVVVTDNGLPTKSDSETITVTVTETNQTPVLSPIGNRSTQEGVKLSFTAAASDADVPANSLVFSLAGGPPSGASITSGGAFSWTPSESQGPGTYTFDVVVTDNGTPVKTDRETITVTVTETNQAPVLATIGNRAVEQGGTLGFTAQASDPDVPTNTLTFSLSGSVPSGASIGASSGVFTWSVPPSKPAGDYVFDVVVTDNGTPVKTDRETITVSVSPVNQAPVLSPVGNRSVDEETTLTFTVDATDSDGPDSSLRFSLSGAPAGASIGSVSGVFTWVPAEHQGPGSHTVRVVVTDAAGVPKSDSETITVTVREVNKPPVVVAPAAQTVNEGDALALTITASDPDSPSNALSFALVGAPEGATIDQSGTLSFAPVDGQGDVTYEFDVKVTDNGSPALSSQAPVVIEVVAVNEAPIIEPIADQYSEEGDEVLLPIVVTDPEAGPVSVVVTGLPQGLAYDALTASIIGTVDEGAAAASPFEVVVTATDADPDDPAETAVSFVWVVDTANTPPTAVPQLLDTNEDTPVTTTLEASDPEGDLITFELASQPSNGSVVISGSTATYRPDANWHGTDGFTFIAADPRETSTPVRITIRVAPVNDPPVAADDVFVAYSGGVLEVAAPGILANDADADGEPLRIGIATTTASGDLEVGADGGFIYRPQEDVLGTDTFTYRLTDEAGASAVGVVMIEIREAVSSGTRSAVVAGVTEVASSPEGEDPDAVRVVSRSLVLMNSAARKTADDMGLPIVVLALVMGLLLSLGRLNGSPLASGKRRTGRIEMVDLEAGYGLIRPDDDPLESVFFHRSALRPRNTELRVGERVTFTSSPGVGRPVAGRLRRAKERDRGLAALRL